MSPLIRKEPSKNPIDKWILNVAALAIFKHPTWGDRRRVHSVIEAKLDERIRVPFHSEASPKR
jgi:hypothetical protein